MREPDGHITTFDAPGAGATAGGSAINALGAIAGSFSDANNVNHGFVRSPDGTFTTIDAPGAEEVAGGTYPAGINLEGTVAGSYGDANGGNHGFVWTPHAGVCGH